MLNKLLQLYLAWLAFCGLQIQVHQIDQTWSCSAIVFLGIGLKQSNFPLCHQKVPTQCVCPSLGAAQALVVISQLPAPVKHVVRLNQELFEAKNELKNGNKALWVWWPVQNWVTNMITCVTLLLKYGSYLLTALYVISSLWIIFAVQIKYIY